MCTGLPTFCYRQPVACNSLSRPVLLSNLDTEFADEIPLHLGEQLEKQFAGAGRVQVAQIKRFVNRTDYRKKHMRAVLGHQETEGTIRVNEYKADGEKRIKGTFPDEAVLEYVTRR